MMGQMMSGPEALIETLRAASVHVIQEPENGGAWSSHASFPVERVQARDGRIDLDLALPLGREMVSVPIKDGVANRVGLVAADGRLLTSESLSVWGYPGGMVNLSARYVIILTPG